MRRTGIVMDRRYLDHATGRHPEHAGRLRAMEAALQSPDLAQAYRQVDPRLCDREELRLIHTDTHIDRIQATAGQPFTYLDGDTVTCPQSYEVARLAAGGVLQAVDLIMPGELDNAFAVVRPPGHHAEADRAMGFCLFNNVAIAASYAIQRYGLQRVMIIDWDLHHGNGTQSAFYDVPEILYCSLHQYPYYPGSGAIQEAGSGPGRGFTVNLPLPAGQGDEVYVGAFEHILLPIARSYAPQLILVSAGFDAYLHDPLGGMQVSAHGFAHMSNRVMAIADQCCQGKVVMVLEGGYHLPGLTDCFAHVLRVMLGLVTPAQSSPTNPLSPEGEFILDRIRCYHQQFWPAL